MDKYIKDKFKSVEIEASSGVGRERSDIQIIDGENVYDIELKTSNTNWRVDIAPSYDTLVSMEGVVLYLIKNPPTFTLDKSNVDKYMDEQGNLQFKLYIYGASSDKVHTTLAKVDYKGEPAVSH